MCYDKVAENNKEVMIMKYKTKDILRMERIKRGWTQEDVAKMLNMARASYAQYETGKNMPTTENIIKLVEICTLSTDYLLGVDFTTAVKTSIKQGMQWGEEIADKTADEIEKSLYSKKRVRKKKSET